MTGAQLFLVKVGTLHSTKDVYTTFVYTSVIQPLIPRDSLAQFAQISRRITPGNYDSRAE